MPPDSDTIIVNTQEKRQERLGPEAQIDREMEIESTPATPTQNQPNTKRIWNTNTTTKQTICQLLARDYL